MKLRTWAQLSPGELKRRRTALQRILIVETIGLAFGGVASAIAMLTTPTGGGVGSILPPFLLAGVCALVYRWSERHWYPAVYLYLFSTLALNVYGLYTFGGAQSPMAGFFAFIVFAAVMLIDLRAGIEWTVVSLIVYGIFAIGVPAGWIELPSEMLERSRLFIYPAFFTVSLVAVSLLFQLFGRSLNQSLEDSRRLARDLEQTARELSDKNRLTEEANRQLQAAAAAEQQRIVELQAATVNVEAVARRSRALYEASREVGRLEADPSATIGSMMRAASGTVGLQAWWVLIFDERRTMLTTLAVSATDQNGPRAVPVSGFENHPIVRSAIRSESHVTNDPLNDPYLKDAPLEQSLLFKTISVPIISRGASVGALVIGHTLDQPDLAQGDLEVAQSLASLIAIAIENSRLLSQTQRALSELDEINRRLTGESWAAFARRRSTAGIMWIGTMEQSSSFGGTDRSQHESLPEVTEALDRGEIAIQPIGSGEQLGVAVPIKLRDVVIGALRLVIPQRAWNADTITTLESIAGHVAQAAENARLLEQTQRTAQREKAIAGAADKIHRSTDLDTVLRAAVAEINRITGLGGVSIQLGFGQAEPADDNGHKAGTDGGK